MTPTAKAQLADRRIHSVAVLKEESVRNLWFLIRLDALNPRPDIKDVDEWLALARNGELQINGMQIVIIE